MEGLSSASVLWEMKLQQAAQIIIGNVHVQMRVEDDTEALTIIFVC